MAKSRRLMEWLMLVLTLGGCSSYKVVSYSNPNGMPDPIVANEDLPGFEIGDFVRIEMVENEIVEGRVSDVSSDSITLKSNNEIGDTELVVIQSDHIASIEKRFPSRGKTMALVGVVIGAFIGVVAVGESANPR